MTDALKTALSIVVLFVGVLSIVLAIALPLGASVDREIAEDRAARAAEVGRTIHFAGRDWIIIRSQRSPTVSILPSDGIGPVQEIDRTLLAKLLLEKP